MIVAALLVAVVVAAGVQVFFLGPWRPWAERARRLADRQAQRGARGVAGVVGRVGAVRHRPVVAAVVVGGLLRLAWIVWATRTPSFISDPAEYLRIAVDLTHGRSPRFGGVGGPSAYWPPGYPAMLAPFVFVAERTGWLSVAFAASLVNAVAGTATIGLTARLARTWLGPRAAGIAAWLVALCPALIYFTSTAHSDTVFIALLLAVLVCIGAPTPDTSSLARWGTVGLLLGAACLVRTPALVVLGVPALALRSRTGRWNGALKVSLAVAVGAAVVLVPWTIRNGLQVGVWTPGSTNNAAAVCFGNHDRAQAAWAESLADPELQLDCFGGSPYLDPELIPIYRANGDRLMMQHSPAVLAEHLRTDEATWYGEKMADAVGWAFRHPREELSLSAQKAWIVWRNEGAAVDSARNYGELGWAGGWQTPLGVAANVWLWSVVALAVVGLVRSPACRRATPVWVPILTITLGIVAAVGEPHYRYPANPLVAVLAAGAVASSRDRDEVFDAVE